MEERPKCENPKCNEQAFVFYSGKWLCGVCCSKFNSKINQYVFDRFVEEEE